MRSNTRTCCHLYLTSLLEGVSGLDFKLNRETFESMIKDPIEWLSTEKPRELIEKNYYVVDLGKIDDTTQEPLPDGEGQGFIHWVAATDQDRPEDEEEEPSRPANPSTGTHKYASCLNDPAETEEIKSSNIKFKVGAEIPAAATKCRIFDFVLFSKAGGVVAKKLPGKDAVNGDDTTKANYPIMQRAVAGADNKSDNKSDDKNMDGNKNGRTGGDDKKSSCGNGDKKCKDY